MRNLKIFLFILLSIISYTKVLGQYIEGNSNVCYGEKGTYELKSTGLEIDDLNDFIWTCSSNGTIYDMEGNSHGQKWQPNELNEKTFKIQVKWNSTDPGFVRLFFNFWGDESSFDEKFDVEITQCDYKITMMYPWEGLPHEEVTIEGENLNSVTEVWFGQIKVKFTIDDGIIKTSVPEGLNIGEHEVTIIGPSGTGSTIFKVIPYPCTGAYENITEPLNDYYHSFRVSHKITASSLVSNQSKVLFQASEIELNPGFSVIAGTVGTFEVKIEVCTPSSSKNSRMASKINEPEVLNEMEPINSLPEELQVFPNPTGGKITINHPFKENDFYNVEIYDYNGQRIIKEKYDKNSIEIELGIFPNGLYVIQLTTTDGQRYSRKVLIKK